MIVIDNVLISDDIVEKQFVCDLAKCKGACCEDGDAGAPLEPQELEELEQNYEKIKPYMNDEGIKEVERQGQYLYDDLFGYVTPTINQKICVYGIRDTNGTIKCAIEMAYNAGDINWKKPLSCHMFPIKMQQSNMNEDVLFLNYEPRSVLCAPACKLGEALKVPVYKFLKEPLIRKFGEEFFSQLQATADHMVKSKKAVH